MRNFLTVFALMVSVSGIAVSLAREEVRCYLGLSSTACQSTSNSPSTPIESSSSQPKETQEQTPIKLPTALEEITKIGEQIKNAPLSNPPEEVTNPTTEAENPPTESTEISEQPTEEKEALEVEVSSPSPETQPITESVELEVIPPPEDNINSSEPIQNE